MFIKLRKSKCVQRMKTATKKGAIKTSDVKKSFSTGLNWNNWLTSGIQIKPLFLEQPISSMTMALISLERCSGNDRPNYWIGFLNCLHPRDKKKQQMTTNQQLNYKTSHKIDCFYLRKDDFYTRHAKPEISQINKTIAHKCIFLSKFLNLDTD